MSHDPRSTEFVRLLTGHQRQLYLFILTLLPDPNDAEYVLGDVNTLLWTKADDFEPGTNFTAWAYRVAHFEVLAFRKRSARQPVYFSEELLATFAEDGAISLKNGGARCVCALRSMSRQTAT